VDSGCNYNLSDVHIANFNKSHSTVSQQQQLFKMELKNRSFQYRKYRLAYLLHVSAERLLRTRSTFSKSVMVSFAVLILGTTELMFIEPGVKINGAYYHNVLLGQHLLPAIHSVAEDFFIFQQDYAPAYGAGDNVAFLSRNTPYFISLLLWSPNTPDLNPVVCGLRGVGCAPATRLP